MLSQKWWNDWKNCLLALHKIWYDLFSYLSQMTGYCYVKWSEYILLLFHSLSPNTRHQTPKLFNSSPLGLSNVLKDSEINVWLWLLFKTVWDSSCSQCLFQGAIIKTDEITAMIMSRYKLCRLVLTTKITGLKGSFFFFKLSDLVNKKNSFLSKPSVVFPPT